MGEHKFKNKRPSNYKAKRSRSLATTIIVILAVGVVIGIDIMQRNNGSPMMEFVSERSKGSEGAPLRIVEFLDFQCSHCKHGAEILKKYMLLYPDDIYLTLKYFPLGQLNSAMSAYYAECAAKQGKFWEMHDLMFEAQDEWRTLLKVKNYLNNLAKLADLDVAELEQCVDSKGVKKTVAKEKALGESQFVKSTPTYFVNGQLTVGIHALEATLKEFFKKQEESAM